MTRNRGRITKQTKTSTMMRLLAGIVTIVLLLAACTADDDDATSIDATWVPGNGGEQFERDDAEQVEPPSAEGGRSDADTDGSAADGGAADGEAESADQSSPSGDPSTGVAPVVLPTSDLGRSIVYTATVAIEVDDVADSSRQAQQAIAAVGGLLYSQDTTSDPRPRTTLVFRVPPADFGEAMERLEGIGEVVDQTISADDVTDRVVDLQSRILTAEVSVERLRTLLDGATSVEAIATLEGQLLDRETNLEQLRGQLRTVESQVSLATITVTITEEAPPTPEPSIAVVTTAYAGEDDGDRCPGEPRLDADEGESVVLCVSVENVGNVDLSGIEVRDLNLDLRREDFTLIDFGDDDVLEPDETVIAWARFDAEPDQSPRPSVTVVPVDVDGDPIRQSLSTNEEQLTLTVVEDDSLPGLGDSLGAGWGALQQVFGVILVVVGVALPFAVIAAIGLGGWLWWRRNGKTQPVIDEPEPAATPT